MQKKIFKKWCDKWRTHIQLYILSVSVAANGSCIASVYECECHKNYNRKDVSIKTWNYVERHRQNCCTRNKTKCAPTTTQNTEYRVIIEMGASHWNSEKFQKRTLWISSNKKNGKKNFSGLLLGRKNELVFKRVCVICADDESTSLFHSDLFRSFAIQQQTTTLEICV